MRARRRDERSAARAWRFLVPTVRRWAALLRNRHSPVPDPHHAVTASISRAVEPPPYGAAFFRLLCANDANRPPG